MKVKVTIEGEAVREVGYRAFLLNLAMENNLRGFSARNVEEGVLVLVEGEEDEVRRFLEKVREERPKYASVSRVRVEEFEGYVPLVERYSWGLMAEQLSKMLQVGIEMVRKQDEGLEVAKETRDLVRENLNVSKETLQVAKETLGVAKETLQVSKETRDLVRGNLNVSKEINGEMKELRRDLKEAFLKEVDRLKAEIKELKEAVAKIEKRIGL